MPDRSACLCMCLNTIGRTESVLVCLQVLIFLFWVEFKSTILVLLLYQYLPRVSENRPGVDRSLS